MNLPIYQIDAFADKLFQGNPAAVCPLKEWLPEGRAVCYLEGVVKIEG